MGDENGGNVAQWYLTLVEPDRGAATGIEQQFLAIGFDKRAHAEAIDV
jgi:hypothetical protein